MCVVWDFVNVVLDFMPAVHDLCTLYWAIQAGLLTPLTFAQHCLSPLVAFTYSAYFLHNGRW